MSAKSQVRNVVDTFHEKNTKTVTEKKRFEEFQKQKSLTSGTSASKLVPLNSSKYDGKGFVSPTKIPRKVSPRSNSSDAGNSMSPPSRPTLVKANTEPIKIPASVASSIYGFSKVDDEVEPEEDLDFSAIQPTTSELDDIEHSNAYLNAMDFEASASDISDNDEPLLTSTPLVKKSPFQKKSTLSPGANDLSDIKVVEGEYEDTPKLEYSNVFSEQEEEEHEKEFAELDNATDGHDSNEGADIGDDQAEPETATVRPVSEVTQEAQFVTAADRGEEGLDEVSIRQNDSSIHDAESTYPESEITEAVTSSVAVLTRATAKAEEKAEEEASDEVIPAPSHAVADAVDAPVVATEGKQEEADATAADDSEYGRLTVEALNFNPPDPETAFEVNVQRQSSRSSLMYSPSVRSEASEDQVDPALTSGHSARRGDTDSVVTVESYRSDVDMLGIEKIDLNNELMLETAETTGVVPVTASRESHPPVPAPVTAVKSAEKTLPKPNVKFSPTANVAGIATTKPTKGSSSSGDKSEKDMHRSYSCGKDDYDMGDIYQQASSPDSNKKTPPSASASAKRGANSGGKNGKSPPSGTSGKRRVDPNLTTITTITNTPQGSFENTFTVKVKSNYDTFNSPIKHKISPLRQADTFLPKPKAAVIINARHDSKALLVFLFHAAVVRLQMAYARQLFYRWKVKVHLSRHTITDKRDKHYSPADHKRLRLAAALASRDGYGDGGAVVERTDDEVLAYGNAHIRHCLGTIFKLFGKLENNSTYQFNPAAAVPDHTVNTSTTYDPGLPLEDLDTSVISTDLDTSTIVTTTRKSNITTTITTVKKLNYTLYDRMRGRVINCHSAKRGFHCWRKYVRGITKIESAVPPSLRLMLLCSQDQLWKMFIPFLPAKVGVPPDQLVEDATTGLLVNTKYKKRLMEMEALWILLREFMICPLLVGKVRLADYFNGVVRDFHPAATVGGNTGGSPDKGGASPSATTPLRQPTTPSSANGLSSRAANGHSSATATNGNSGDKRSKSPNRTGAAASVNSKAQPGLRQSFVSPEGCKIRLTLFANEVTSVTGREYAAPDVTSGGSGIYNGTKTPPQQTSQSHTRVTPSTTFKELDLSHIHSAISNNPHTPTGNGPAPPAAISLLSFQKLLWRIAVDCLLPREELVCNVSNGTSKSDAASIATAAVTPLEHFTSLAYEEQQGLLEWYFALMMGTKRTAMNHEILKLLKNVTIYDEKKSAGGR